MLHLLASQKHAQKFTLHTKHVPLDPRSPSATEAAIIHSSIMRFFFALSSRSNTSLYRPAIWGDTFHVFYSHLATFSFTKQHEPNVFNEYYLVNS